ncbi:MAG: ribosomal protein S6 modification protein [Candidatus Berkelbacteria bacterium Licking1014_7]|uniref:Ribosomal protein S6 modification protein n=1 Tax=Candidatus Berkelbacteria bacterium Licking1014_7 TaxID=2017147 RepID=A0A554LJA5_9BACT|nr:MAG: ribosomal protein S6 modification protein [Candidatus Berkelbacteria bacterium Licking1014_7]
MKIKQTEAKRIGIYTINTQMKVIKRLKKESERMGLKPEIINYSDVHIAVSSPRKFSIYLKNEKYSLPSVILNRLPAIAPGLSLMILSHFERTRRSVIINRAFRASVARDKFRTMQVLASKGFEVPNTVLIGSSKERDLKWVVKAVGGFPAILKLTRGSLGMGVVKVENFATLRSVLDLVKRTRKPMILQQFIGIEPGVDYRFYVVGYKVVATMKRSTRKKDEFRANLALGGKGTKYIPTKDEVKLAIALANTLRLPICGIDFIRTEKGMMPIEVNVNAMIGGIEKATGVNVARKIIEYCITEREKFLGKKIRRNSQ